MVEMAYDLELDATGLMCPEPVMMLHNRMAEVPVDGILKVVATDPSTTRDVPRFCQFLNHTLVQENHTETEFVYYIRRGE
ncbi:sulfurtransferase TusA [Marinobacter halodurans]|uniref:Sulfurtransferase TusA n=2 Tax=Marinobacter halodurans TaxID=2528979 RepID=A0ABY1ZQE6_9GAMM|nr:sulfurtransferase TusA [Marinobacter halodurans]